MLEGFGRSARAACRYATPRSQEELAETLARARAEGLRVGFRGAGRSYGDAALNTGGLVVDITRMDRLIRWEPQTGELEAEAGLTIEGLWRRTIEDGYWPAVVPGTMRPTLGGCLSMNIHGKNNFRVGSFGEHVQDFDLLTVGGDLLRCSRTENPELFHSVIGGVGLLGAITRVKLALKRVESGYLRVQALAAKNLSEMLDTVRTRLPESDYLVGWIDCFSRRSQLGRGVVHAAEYVTAGEDPDGQSSLHVETQGLPSKLLGFPRAKLWKVMRYFTNDPGVALVNALKYRTSSWSHGKTYLQSHVAFAFLLDYVPDWRLAYGAGGFIQYQVFVPDREAESCLGDVLELCQRAGMPAYLGVLKRHRPDPFLLTHALDGWSLALDFRVTHANRNALWQLTRTLTDRVLEASGKFYFAKDSVLSMADVQQAYGRDRLDAFWAIKQRLDPQNLLSHDLAQRALYAP